MKYVTRILQSLYKVKSIEETIGDFTVFFDMQTNIRYAYSINETSILFKMFYCFLKHTTQIKLGY